VNGLDLGDKVKHRLSGDIHKVIGFEYGHIVTVYKVNHEGVKDVRATAVKIDMFWTVFEEV